MHHGPFQLHSLMERYRFMQKARIMPTKELAYSGDRKNTLGMVVIELREGTEKLRFPLYAIN